MTLTFFHPATLELLRLQSRGRRRRMWQRFCQPRRLVLSAIACILAVVWFGNLAFTIWLRESASPATLHSLLSMGLVFYTGWHIAKTAFFRPESPFDWTPAEQEILTAMPLRPRDLMAYQLAAVTLTTSVKSGLFMFLLLPDMRSVPLGLCGVFLAMMMLELLRMGIGIVAWGMSRAAFLTYRALTLAGLLAIGFAAGVSIVRNFTLSSQFQGGPFRPLLDILIELNASVLGDFATPFQPFVELIVADRMSSGNAWLAVMALAMVTSMAVAVIGLYAMTSRHMAIRERQDYASIGHVAAASRAADLVRLGSPDLRVIGHVAAASRAADLVRLGSPDLRVTGHGQCRADHQRATTSRPLRLIPHWGGAGPLAWRQLVGARRHWGSLLAAMIAPAVLSAAPCLVIAEANFAFLATAGTLAFYSFLLLPTALRFDFRRDLDRLATLKNLPIGPAAAVVGQTLTPVLIATLFQSVVLTFAIAVRSLPLENLLVAILVLTPMNVLVFGLDNLIYLLYPYRMQQEGLEIFLRTMLTFTGKGLLFSVGLVAVSGWGFAAAAATRGVSEAIAIDTPAVFLLGVIAGLSSLAVLVLGGLCRTYGRLNAIEDVPR